MRREKPSQQGFDRWARTLLHRVQPNNVSFDIGHQGNKAILADRPLCPLNFSTRLHSTRLFNGAIRNSENEELARLLRQKSKVSVAFGSCAYEGCIPALSNFTSKEATYQAVYLDNPSTDNPNGTLPQPVTEVPEGELDIPVFYNTVKSLDQVVPVDYYIPGCPPEPHQIASSLPPERIKKGNLFQF